jgi:hypothetical protein
MRMFQECFEKPEFRHHVERRRMDRVAAKVAQKIRVFLEQNGPDTRARKKQSGHHSGRTASHDATPGLRFPHPVVLL